jgi:hypothetical protein
MMPCWTARHPDRAPVIFWTELDPALRLRAILMGLPTLAPIPLEGWRLSMDGLSCQFCGEWNRPGMPKPLVEIIQTHRGPVLECACCGKVGPLARVAGPRGSVSGKTGS